MVDTELIFALFKPPQIREKPPDDSGDQNETPAQKQKAFLDDLKAEQLERM